jgi:hypothetical protein
MISLIQIQVFKIQEVVVKNRQTYKVLTFLGAFFLFGSLPINRMYLGEKWVLRLFTFNFMFFGVYADLFYMDKRFDETMTRRGLLTHKSAIWLANSTHTRFVTPYEHCPPIATKAFLSMEQNCAY